MKLLILVAAGALAVAPAAGAATHHPKPRPDAARQDGLVIGAILSPDHPGYRVVDAARHNLPAAPSGYHYVRVGRNAYLRQARTGVIAAVFQGVFR
jgi:hypothetical protein